MRALVLALLLLAAAAAAEPEEPWLLLGIRDDVGQDPDAAPPRTTVRVDVLAPGRRLETREVTLRDPAMRRCLFHDPFLVPARPDRAYLVVTDGGALRAVRLSWSTGEDTATSRRLDGARVADLRSRPVHVVPERVAFLAKRGVITLDLRLDLVVESPVRYAPLFLDTGANRLYVEQAGSLYRFGFLATDPPRKVDGPATLVYALPDGVRPEHGFVHGDGLRVAYVSAVPSRRPDAERFLLSVADHRERLLARRSFPGRFHDLRWIDERTLLITATQRETTVVSVLDYAKGKLDERKLPERYLAPPEIVPSETVRGAGE